MQIKDAMKTFPGPVSAAGVCASGGGVVPVQSAFCSFANTASQARGLPVFYVAADRVPDSKQLQPIHAAMQAMYEFAHLWRGHCIKRIFD